MAAVYEWTKDMETGHPLIDTQHKQLIKAINDLLAACSSGKGRAALDGTLDFLSQYTAKHFGDEEKLQQQHKYPDFANHKKLHDAFKNTVADLAKQLRAEGPTVTLVGKVNASIAGWLVNHIKREDVKVAAHIRSVQ
ncbi:MAG: bacteriohemerythrin [Gracilibacteraceae bacterium]|jgi:hemerythrin|nr:bacteriohemerythrin [Gracilibacteraceae bacterium]